MSDEATEPSDLQRSKPSRPLTPLQRAATEALRSLSRPAFPGLESVAAKLVEDARQSVASAAGVVALNQVRLADYAVPDVLRAAELSITARWADLMAPEGPLVVWRQSLLIQEYASQAAAEWHNTLSDLNANWLAEIAKTSEVVARISEAALEGVTASGFRLAIAAEPSRQLHGYLLELPQSPSVHQLAIGARATHGVAGFTAFDVARRQETSSGALEQLEGAVLAPWVEGPQGARDDLLRRLSAIDPELADLLLGAWVEAVEAGPGAVVKLTSCAVEIIERTLRAIAPNDEVLAWHSAGRRPKSEIDSKGGPTYAARVRFVLEGRTNERKLAVSQVDALVSQVSPLRTIFQGGKHASAGALVAFRAHLMSAEAFLMQLLIDD